MFAPEINAIRVLVTGRFCHAVLRCGMKQGVGPMSGAPHPGHEPGGTTRVSTFADRDLVIGVTPFAEPRPRLTAAVARAGALGVLDLGRDRAAALAALAEVRRWWSGAFGVRVGPGCPLAPDDLPSEVDTVVLAPGQRWDGPQRVLAEV